MDIKSVWNGFNNALGSNVGKLATSIIGTAMANKNARKMQETAFAQEKALMDKQNAYNDPSAQMRRLQNAGLNVNMMYGDNAATFEAANGSAPAPAPVANFADSTQQFESDVNRIKTKAEVDNLAKQMENLIQIGEGLKLDNAVKRFSAVCSNWQNYLLRLGVLHKYNAHIDDRGIKLPESLADNKELREAADNFANAFTNASEIERRQVEATISNIRALTDFQELENKNQQFSVDNVKALDGLLNTLAGLGDAGKFGAALIRGILAAFIM